MFLDSTHLKNIIEKKNAAVQALFNLVKEYGMIFIECFTLEFLLSDENFFKEHISPTDSVGLSELIYKLYSNESD